MSSEDNITQAGAAEQAAPDAGAQEQAASEQAASEQAASEQAASEAGAQEQAASEQAAADAGAPDPDLAPEELAGDAASEAPEPDYRDLYVRAAAETDNVRKRARRDVAAAHDRGVARLAKELLPALDNLERALAHAEAQEGEGEHEITRGIRLVQQELISSLERVGIVPEAPKGELFDPHRHEAVAHTPVEGVASGTITDVYSAGYRFGDDVLRAAKVVVAQ